MRRAIRSLPVALALTLILAACSTTAVPPEIPRTDAPEVLPQAVAASATIDFEGLTEGQIVSSVSDGSGVSGDPIAGLVSVLGTNPALAIPNAAMIFDAECGGAPAGCSGGDADLFAPGQGNVLIITEDGDGADPDDADVNGEAFSFDFSGFGPGVVDVDSLLAVDVEASENESATVSAFAPGGALIGMVEIPSMNNGETALVELNFTGVERLSIALNGSGAIDDIEISIPLAALGDRVFLDENSNGVQDPGEPGVPDVPVELQDCSGNVLASTVTDADGLYLFDDLDAGCYVVVFDLPSGFAVSPPDQGADDAADSDADPVTGRTGEIDLDPGETDLTNDAGIAPCAACKGGIVELTFRYRGAAPADVTVYDDGKANPDKVLFQGSVQPGDIIRVTPRPGEDKLKSDISVFLDGAFDRKIHTSCSQPIEPGLILGVLEIVAAVSKDNGPICPLGGDCSISPQSVKLDSNKFEWKIENTGSTPLIVKKIEISWPQANGAIEKISLDGTVFEGLAPPTSATFEGPDFDDDVKNRRIKPGDEKTFKVEFENDVGTDPTDYQLRIEFFGADCALEFDGTSPPVTECTTKVQKMLLRYTGPTVLGATVVIDPGKGSSVTYSNVDLISGVTVLASSQQNGWTIDATAGSEDELGSNTTILINGVPEDIHTSCSTPFIDDAPAPLSNPKGDPSPTWFVEDFVQKP